MKDLEKQILSMDVKLEEHVLYLCFSNTKTGIVLIDNHVLDYHKESRMATQAELEYINFLKYNKKVA